MFKSQEIARKNIGQLLTIHQESDAEIRPHAIITGPTGSGKTYLINQLCKELDISCFSINAAQLTAEGLSGNSLSKAMRPLIQTHGKPNVVIVDEFDKLFQRGGTSAEGFRSDVQDEFLHVLENDKASVFTDYGKYEPISVEKTLFLFAGAFNGQKATTAEELQALGLRPEFVGRVPLVIPVNAVTLPELLAAIPDTALFRAYSRNFKLTKTGQQKAVDAIAAHIENQYRKCDLGVRAITSCTHRYFIKEHK